jgi:hypothetical protein
MMITLVKAVQTAIACPSQWDAWDAHGNYYYLRYRHGYGEMRQYTDDDWVGAPSRDDVPEDTPGWIYLANTKYLGEIAHFEYGHPLDGSITLEKFAELAGIALAPEIDRAAFWRDAKNKLDEEFKDDPEAQSRAESFFEGINLDEE